MNLTLSVPSCSPRAVPYQKNSDILHSPTGYTSYEMVGSEYSSATGLEDDMPVALLKTNLEKPAGSGNFRHGKVFPSDGAWTSDDIGTERRKVCTPRYV
jgi:hypothetical protein